MCKDPLISILTPLYNKQEYIAQCIECVVDQGYDRMEHIIQDGQSTDGSIDIVNEYAQKYKHIRFYSETDQGQSQAMNRAIGKSNGEIIGFLNADDYYEPNIFNKVADFFESLSEHSLLIGNCRVWKSETELLCINKPKAFTLLDLVKRKDYPWNASGYFYHKSIHNVIGLYDEKEHYMMDLDFLARAYSCANVHYMDELLGNFRLMPGCKTFENAKCGQMLDRIDDYLMNYYQKLTFWDKASVLRERFINRAVHFSNRLKEKVKIT